MKFVYTSIILALVGGGIVGSARHFATSGIFSLYEKAVQSRNGMRMVEDYDPRKDMIFFPSLQNKKLFAAVEDLSICSVRDIRKYVYSFLTGNRAYTMRAIARSYLYLDIIQKVFAEYPDVPEDLALLPLLESGFDPFAVSRSRAVGLWQFLRGTSTALGLRTDTWRDERRNIEKSTRAAVRHLRNMYSVYGSWELALAAYNGGGVQITNAIRRTGVRSIWELRKLGVLTAETREYVPKFIALLLIYKNQVRFNIEDDIPVPAKKKLTVITLKKPLFIKQVAQLAEVKEHFIRQVNPELHGNSTPVNCPAYALKIPYHSREKFLANLEKLYKYQKELVCKN